MLKAWPFLLRQHQLPLFARLQYRSFWRKTAYPMKQAARKTAIANSDLKTDPYG